MDFRILGPLEVHGDRGAIDVPHRKPRAVLAYLLLHANEPVSAERLAVALWGEEASAGAIRTVHVNVSRLRKALGAGEILTTTPAGYRLQVRPGELDADRFQQLVEDGRRALARGQYEEAGTVLREALALWRGTPLADLAFEAFAQTEIARLEEQHEAAIEARVEADLAAGRHAELVGELRQLVAEHPTHERLAGQLMLALYRSGRQGDALDAYRQARHRLSDELGVEPGAELRALQDAILHHDRKLALDGAGELPHELDAATAPPLVGRESELEWLRDRWAEARGGHGRLIALAGAPGMGKSRLAAELAKEVHDTGGSVLYTSGAGPARAVHQVLERSRDARRPLLLIADDADQAPADVLSAVRDIAGGSVLVLATATDHEALGGLDPGVVLFLDLDRLGPAAVAKIAALYVPDDQTADVLPAEWLLGASAGVPQRVHDVASQWARERVGAAAGRAAAERSRLRSMEDELAGGVVQLQAVREWREPPGDGDQRVVCPFKGLASFEAADAPYFFGRERLVAELVARLVGAPLLGVVGPSGSGKSSVMRAGLLPALESGVLPGSEHWPQHLMRPGEHPLRQLREATAAAPSSGRFVLAVDQFEETFMACRDENERADFIAELVRASSAESGGVVVVALRADFYGRCAEYPALSRLLAANHVLVGPMQPEELRRAITCPAQRVGLSVDDELAEAIVRDVEDAPGALPLVSTALLELWQNRDGRRLRLASYERTGGVRGAVARLAEEAYGALDGDQRELARRLLLQLVEVDDEGAVERRRVPLADIGADAEPLLDVLADARLVTLSEGAVELAHEALLREWPRLHGWIEDGLEDLRVERTLRAAASEWERVDRDPGALYRGARLAEASDWSERSGRALPDLERDFLQTSLDRADRDRSYRRRRLTLAFGGLAFGLIAIAVVAAIALQERGQAERERDRATSRVLAAEAENNIEIDPALALRLALWALDTDETPEAAAALRDATSAFRQQAVVRADPVEAWTAQLSPDGKRLVTGGGEGTAVLWDAATHERVARWAAGHGGLWSSRFARDGERIALGFDDGTVAVTDASLDSHQELARVKNNTAWSVAFVGDGDRVAAAFDDGTVRVFTLDKSEPPQVLEGHEGPVYSVDASVDGTRVVSAGGDGTVRLWTLADGTFERLHSGAGAMLDAAFSPDGKVILAVGDDGLVRRWNARTRREGPSTPGGGSPLNSVAFSADGDRFAAGGVDGNVLVWAVPGGPPVASLRGPGAFVYDVGFGRTGDVVAGAFDDGTVRLWDPGRIQFWTVPQATGSIAFNRDGRYILTPSMTGDVSVWDAATGRLVNRLPGSGERISTQFSPAADEVIIADENSPDVRVWPIDQATDTVEFRAPRAKGLIAARVDSSGERIVYVDTDGTVAVGDLDSGREIPLEGGPKDVENAQFSADGTRVAVMSQSGRGAIWRVDRPTRPERWLTGHRDRGNALQYGDDDRVLTAGNDKTVRVWPARDGPSTVMTGHRQGVSDAAFWTDPSKVLSVSFDGTLRLWNSRTGVSLGVLETGTRPLYGMAVSRDGKIAILDADSVVRVSGCDVCGSLEAVERLARSLNPRALTADERRRYLAALD